MRFCEKSPAILKIGLFSMKSCAFCDQLHVMQVYITMTPLMLYRSSNFILFLRTFGLKKNIILGKKIKVKTNFLILITCIFTYIQSVNLARVLNSNFCEM